MINRAWSICSKNYMYLRPIFQHVTHTCKKFWSHDSTLFSSPLQSDFNISVIFSFKNIELVHIMEHLKQNLAAKNQTFLIKIADVDVNQNAVEVMM